MVMRNAYVCSVSTKTIVDCYVSDHALCYGNHLKHWASAGIRHFSYEQRTAAVIMIIFSFNKSRRVPRRAISVRLMRHIMIHVVTTTRGPWLSGVMRPCGGYVPPLLWKSSFDGIFEEDIDMIY